MGLNINTQPHLETQYPNINSYKGFYPNLLSLQNTRRCGKLGWFAFLMDAKTFAYWDADADKWDVISGEGADYAELLSALAAETSTRQNAITTLASTVFTIFEKYNIAKALEEKVVQMFPGFKSIKGSTVQ